MQTGAAAVVPNININTLLEGGALKNKSKTAQLPVPQPAFAARARPGEGPADRAARLQAVIAPNLNPIPNPHLHGYYADAQAALHAAVYAGMNNNHYPQPRLIVARGNRHGDRQERLNPQNAENYRAMLDRQQAQLRDLQAARRL